MAKTFESSLSELEKIVEQLESGEMPLEESLKLFENGVRLSRECRERLNEAERRIEILIKDGEGKLSLSEFNADLPSEMNTMKRIVFEDD